MVREEVTTFSFKDGSAAVVHEANSSSVKTGATLSAIAAKIIASMKSSKTRWRTISNTNI